MLHLLKYRLLHVLRDKTTMFWACAFPILLATFFYLAIGKGSFDDAFREIPVAFVTEGEEEQGAGAEAFPLFLEEMDGEMFVLTKTDEETALRMLDEGEVEGIFYDTKRLSVSSSSITSSILESVLETYVKNEAVIKEIAEEHPEKLPEAAGAVQEYVSMTEEVSTGGDSLDTGLSFFFALMAMACLYGCFPGLQCMMETRANLSALGARQCITPTGKGKRILANFIVTYAVQSVNTIAALCYIKYVLKIGFGGNTGGMILICMMGSAIGVSIGILVGCIGKLGEGAKVGIILGISMSSSFLAGLMSPDVRTMMEMYLPGINRINPATVIVDAFYYLNIYNDSAQFLRCLTTLGIMSAALMAAGFLAVRRERYDSI